MRETKELLRRGAEGFAPRKGVMDSLIRRRARKDRNRRIATATLAIAVTLVAFIGLTRTFRSVQRPANEPTDIFARVHGWIAYGNKDGIWAVDPARPGHPGDQVQLSPLGGKPLAWSGDGSNLLIRREGKQERPAGLFVLNSDGTETRLTRDGFTTGGSFSPDGMRVVYGSALSTEFPTRIYVIDAEGGTPKVLLTARRRWIPALGRRAPTFVFMPTVSPDGTQVAYFDGMYDHSNSLWAMNADGSDPQVLVDAPQLPGFLRHLVWSPDGTRLAFEITVYGSPGTGIYVVNADGSGLRLAIPGGSNPSWSPDDSRISYQVGAIGTLVLAAPDGTHVVKFGYGGSGPWNPLPLSESDDGEPTAAAGWLAPFVYAIVALGVVGVLVLVWRARGRTAAI